MDTYVWDHDFANNHPVFKDRTKSVIKSKYLKTATFVHQIFNPSNEPELWDNKSYCCMNYNEIRLVHYRVPNLTESTNAKFILDNTIKNTLENYE